MDIKEKNRMLKCLVDIGYENVRTNETCLNYARTSHVIKVFEYLCECGFSTELSEFKVLMLVAYLENGEMYDFIRSLGFQEDLPYGPFHTRACFEIVKKYREQLLNSSVNSLGSMFTGLSL